MNEPKDLKQQIADLQQQILQSEKLASLGLLSAGITHEIQNPLNFVINFSQMATDLVDDLEELLEEEQIDLDDPAHEELAETLSNLRLYLAKIANHGHRATDIIQGILRYSRGKEDLFVPTDMAHLLKEYVWLSYHAMRANLPCFNVTIHESYASDLPEVKVIPQDISRAIINLMKANGIIDGDVEPHLDLYFTICSLSANCRDMAFFAAVLANNGVNPNTKEQLIPLRVVKLVRSLMVTCGMYDYSGEYAATVGMPSKSGVGGGIIAAPIGKCGIAAYGPALDEKGKSVGGLKIMEFLSEKMDLHMF